MALWKQQIPWSLGLCASLCAAAGAAYGSAAQLFETRTATSPLLSQVDQCIGLEVRRLQGQATYQGSSARLARIGDCLGQVGHSLTTAVQTSALLQIDDGIGTVRVAEATHMVLRRLSTLSDGARITRLDVTRGQARIQVRPFTNPNSLFEMHTPSGVVAVRGTEFGVTVDADGRTAVGTLTGSVEASAQGRAVEVEAGLATVIRPGQPPIDPVALDRDMRLIQRDIYRSGRQIYVLAQVNPTNSVFLEGQELEVERSGFIRTVITLPYQVPDFKIVVRNPLGEERSYRVRALEIDGR